jgi:hypothetical protein
MDPDIGTMSTPMNLTSTLRPGDPAALLRPLAGAAAIARTFLDGIREGRAAERTYDDLVRRGVPHATAVERALIRR